MFSMACTISILLGNGGNGNGKLSKINALAFPFPWKRMISNISGNAYSSPNHALPERSQTRGELTTRHIKPLGNRAAG